MYFGVADRDIFTRIGYSGEEPDNIAMAQVEHPNKGKISLVLYSAKMGNYRVAFYAHPVFSENNDSDFAVLLSQVNNAKSSGDLTHLLSFQIGNKELRAYFPQKIRN